MEPVASIIDKLKSFGENFINGFGNQRQKKSRQNSIEILKRLQREAFADLMKLRDRQDKMERVLTSYKTVKGGPFQEDGTVVRGEVDVMGTLYLTNNLEQENDAIERAGIRTGIDSRITFETKVREKGVIKAEFVAGQSNHRDAYNNIGNALSLARVSYNANITDWCAINAIPIGARCRDMSNLSDSTLQEKGLTDYSSFGPPLLHEDHGRAIGLTVKGSNFLMSTAGFVADLPGLFGHCFNSFGHVICQLPMSSNLSFFALYQVPKPRQHASPGPLAIPLGSWLHSNRSVESLATSSPISTTNVMENNPGGLIAAMLESELDESTRVRGWVQMRDDPKHVQWSVSMTDFPEDEIGWGLSLGGSTKGSKSWDHFQVEAFLKFNLGKKLSVQPGFVYLMEGSNQIPALMCHSTWSI